MLLERYIISVVYNTLERANVIRGIQETIIIFRCNPRLKTSNYYLIVIIIRHMFGVTPKNNNNIIIIMSNTQTRSIGRYGVV